METNFIKERKTCCTKSVIAVATGTLYMLEKEKEMLSRFSRKEESVNHFTNFFSQIHKYVLDIHGPLYNLIEEYSRNWMVKLNANCFITIISIAETHKKTQGTHPILNALFQFHCLDKSTLTKANILLV